MGLFSSKKIITVASSLYNMAGDERDRPNFLKGTLFGATIANSPSLGDEITKAYFNGSGMKQRQFFRWADRNNLPGIPSASVRANDPISPSSVIPHIPVRSDPPGLQVDVSGSEVSDGDFEPWIFKWISENYPTRLGEQWLGEYNPTTNEFSVQFPNGDFFSWLNTNSPIYSKNSRYIIARYIEYLDSSEASVEQGTLQQNQTNLPDLTGFSQTVNTPSFTPVTLQRTRTTVWSYSNGDPDQIIENGVSANVDSQLNTGYEEWQREVVISRNGLAIQGERQIWNFTGDDIVTNDYVSTVVTTTDLGGGIIRTETKTTIGEQVTNRWNMRYDTQDIFEGNVIGGEQMFIYKVGTGNPTLDALVSETGGISEFYPFMPVRIDNVSIMHNSYANDYEQLVRGYRRAFQGERLSSLVEAVEDNDAIDDIDYAYIVFGVSLNVKEMACRKYIFNFMENLIPFQRSGSGNAMAELQADVNAYNSALNALETWESQVDNHSGNFGLIPDRPELPKISPPPTSTIRLAEDKFGFDVRLNWVHIEINQYNGNYGNLSSIPGGAVKKDDLILVNGPSFTWQERDTYNSWAGIGQETKVQFITKSVPSMYIYWQVGSNTYRRMQIWGFNHQNYVYGGKSVDISSTEALNDDEESGFVIPLHYPTFSNMNIVDYTQMSTANTHILFNSYEVTIQRWYERGIFKILLVILIIVIAVVISPGAFSAGGGVLGGNLAIGSALGLTGTAALVAGVVSNYIASMIISQVLSIVGTALFGEKWGALFAAIAGFAFGMAMSGAKLFSAQGLLGLANAIANGYAGWVQGDINEMREDWESDRQAYEDRMDYINDLMSELLGGNDLNFNPMFLTDSLNGNGYGRGGQRGYLPETSDEFIQRTTMTGTDIVELTHSMVYDYVDMTNTLPRN